MFIIVWCCHLFANGGPTYAVTTGTDNQSHFIQPYKYNLLEKRLPFIVGEEIVLSEKIQFLGKVKIQMYKWNLAALALQAIPHELIFFRCPQEAEPDKERIPLPHHHSSRGMMSFSIRSWKENTAVPYVLLVYGILSKPSVVTASVKTASKGLLGRLYPKQMWSLPIQDVYQGSTQTVNCRPLASKNSKNIFRPVINWPHRASKYFFERSTTVISEESIICYIRGYLLSKNCYTFVSCHWRNLHPNKKMQKQYKYTGNL